MKKRYYQRFSILLFIVSVSIGVYGLSITGFFNKNKILVKELSCSSCANYEVFLSSFKIAQQVQETDSTIKTSQVFINGATNPYTADYTKTYDYYIVTGKVSGLEPGDSTNRFLYPVLTVSAWQDISIVYVWLLMIVAFILFVIAIVFYRKYLNENRLSVLEASVLSWQNH
jgi:hypothetical protein